MIIIKNKVEKRLKIKQWNINIFTNFQNKNNFYEI